MRFNLVQPLALTVSLALLTAACQKPAAEAAQVADSATEPAISATDPGGAISPAQANGAINPDANATIKDAAPASNSFTEGQAKGHIENAGYTEVDDLKKTSDGLWTATARKDGKSVAVTVDFKGAVTVG